MKPADTGRAYYRIAAWWDAQQAGRTAGLTYVQRAIGMARVRSKALDVGCGSGGAVIEALLAAGFDVVGLDVSGGLIARAQTRHAGVQFEHADICEWKPPASYDLIVAWDSTFHLPRASQRTVYEKLCDALVPGGALLFTVGGVDGEITGEMQGEVFHYSSFALSTYVDLLEARGCRCVVIDRDQYPEEHVVIIAVKPDMS